MEYGQITPIDAYLLGYGDRQADAETEFNPWETDETLEGSGFEGLTFYEIAV